MFTSAAEGEEMSATFDVEMRMLVWSKFLMSLWDEQRTCDSVDDTNDDHDFIFTSVV